MLLILERSIIIFITKFYKLLYVHSKKLYKFLNIFNSPFYYLYDLIQERNKFCANYPGTAI